ncbi:MAG: hypothetical protein MR902_00320 [Campylobacter sp.]|nr:hypothetical protein [Campylobacter sp.]
MKLQASKILFRLVPYLKIISNTTGRLRVQISPDIKSKKDEILDGIEYNGLDLGEIVSRIDRIKSYKLNSVFGTLTLIYDPNLISKEFWSDLVDGKNQKEIKAKIDELERRYYEC